MMVGARAFGPAKNTYDLSFRAVIVASAVTAARGVETARNLLFA